MADACAVARLDLATTTHCYDRAIGVYAPNFAVSGVGNEPTACAVRSHALRKVQLRQLGRAAVACKEASEVYQEGAHAVNAIEALRTYRSSQRCQFQQHLRSQM